jgi:hypothetical protein
MQVGSESHKELFCRSLLESFVPFEPEDLSWPELDDKTLELLRSIPFWEEALLNEQNAGPMVNACADTLSDPLVREAMALQGYEESRHARILQHLVRLYRLDVTPPPVAEVPPDAEAAFVEFGYTECLEAFGAFGLFQIARETAFIPDPLLTIFDRVMDEEARHMVFFVNWVNWDGARRGRPRALRAARAGWCYAGVLRHLLGRARAAGEDANQDAFTLTGASAFVENLTLTRVLETCVRENARRRGRFDPRLLQPRLMPRLARTAHGALRLLPGRRG